MVEVSHRPFVWIVSYPRSGSTLLRTLLSSYFHGDEQVFSLSDLSRFSVGEHNETLWRELTGEPPVDRTVEIEWRSREAYIAQMRARAAPEVRLFKAHTVNGEAFGAKAYSFQPGDHIVHVVRHPCDVALSCEPFYGISREAAVERLLTAGTVIDGRPAHGFEVVGSWDQHTRLWLSEQRAPRHTVRYFELAEQPAETLEAVLRFLGEPIEAARLARAVEAAQFQRLKAQEQSTGFEEKSKADIQFFREGRPLQWLEQLAVGQAARLVAPSRDILDLLGFTDYVAASSPAVAALMSAAG